MSSLRHGFVGAVNHTPAVQMCAVYGHLGPGADDYLDLTLRIAASVLGSLRARRMTFAASSRVVMDELLAA